MPEPVGTRAEPLAVEEAIAAIREHLGRLRFGAIPITIHVGRVVHLNITEERRLAR